ncbi:MAG TPA: RNA polymerase sigma factor [Candidatus Paceibacterota bacterium]|nr:RNA polymerase sigma factor [Candidatus Paceibacterota bacterium]
MKPFDHNPALPFPVAGAPSLEDDAALVRSFLAGNDRGFSDLLDRHMPTVYRFAYRYLANVDDASDVTQETFIRAWKHLATFDQARSFRTWLLTIARNASLDFIKKKKPLLFSQLEAADADLDTALAPYVESPELPDAMFDRMATARVLDQALLRLSAPYRIVLSLRYAEGFKFREIAEILGEPIDTVKSKHRRGLQQLKKHLPAGF